MNLVARWKALPITRKLDAAAIPVSFALIALWPTWWTVAGALLSIVMFAIDPGEHIRSWLLKRLVRPRGTRAGKRKG